MALALSPPGWSRAPSPGRAAEAMAPGRLAASRLAPGPRVSAVAAAAAALSAAPPRLPLEPSVKYRFFSCCLRKWTLRSLPAAHGFYPGHTETAAKCWYSGCNASKAHREGQANSRLWLFIRQIPPKSLQIG